MKNPLAIILIFLLATSCQYFETEKISSETILEEELKTIDWKEVDTYPTFQNCENFTEKPQQKDCFINTISSHLYQSVNDKNILAVRAIHDTVLVAFSVSNKGELVVSNITIDSLLQKEFPQLEEWILKSIDSLQPVAPAYKRGIPVKTQFTLPVIIQTN